MIDKYMRDDIREHPNLDPMVIENNGSNLVRNHCDGLHLEKNNNL